MKRISAAQVFAITLALLAPIGFSAVVEPPDGKENPLTEPNEPLPKPTQRPAADEEKSVIPEPTALSPATFTRTEFNPKPMVRVDVLMVALPHEQALLLLPELRDATKIRAAEQKLLQMISRKEANLVDWPEVTLHSGERAVCETITERRYPIEFDQPQETQTLSSTPKVQRTPAEEALRILRLAGLLVPITFETRNTGATLEVEAVVSPNEDAITIHTATQIVTLDKMVDFQTMPGKKEDGLRAQQPLFQTRKTSLRLTLQNGERRLIYVGKPQESEGKMELFILGAQILPRPK